ncbi:MAG: GAF domain-containing protein [Fusobacteriaceae bacterium]|nr:GAF domain-containing protein [Fusobacteriaceae bacterium]
MADMTARNFDLLLEQAKSLADRTLPFYSNLSNISALIMDHFSRLNWAGFYLLEGEELLLGPFQGKPACTRIPLGKGVCGHSASIRETVVVPDVHAFPGHIACDGASQSEIVVPLCDGEKLFGVLDVDSPVLDRFSREDQTFFEALATGVIVPFLSASPYFHN